MADEITLPIVYNDAETLENLDKTAVVLTKIADAGDAAGEALSQGFKEAATSAEVFNSALDKNASAVADQAKAVQGSEKSQRSWRQALNETLAGLSIGGKSLGEWRGQMQQTSTATQAAAANTEKAAGGFKIFNTILKASIIGAIVALVLALINYFKQFQPVVDTVARVVAGFNAVINELANRIVKVGEAFGKFFSGDFSGAADTMKEAFTGLGAAIVNAAQAAYQLEQRAQSLRDAIIASSVAVAQQRADLEKLKAAAQDETLSYRDRTKAIQQGFAVETQISATRIAQAKENRDIILAQNKLAADNVDAREKAAAAEIELIEAQSESDKIRRDFEKELRELRQQASAERKKQIADELKQLEEVRKAIERLRVETQPAGIEQDLAVVEKKYNDLQLIAADGIKKLNEIEKRRDLTPAELQQRAELGQLSVQLEARRLEALLDVVAGFAEKDAELEEAQRKAKAAGAKRDKDAALKTLDDRRKLGEEEIAFVQAQGERLILRLEEGGASREKIEAAKDALQTEIHARRLENEIAFNQRLLEIETDPARVAQIIAVLKTLGAELQNLDIPDPNDKPKPLTIWDLLGIEDPNVQGGLGEAAKQIIAALEEITAARVAAAEKATELAEKRVSEAEELVRKEQELADEGLRNNLSNANLKLAQEKQARDKALREEARAKRAQILLDSVQQGSSLITASANIFASLSKIPFVGIPLAIGVIGLMLGAFTAAKIKALQSVQESAPKLRHGKRITGRRHEEGGEEHIGIDGKRYEVEGPVEWVIGSEASQEHDKFLGNMNAGKYKGLNLEELVGSRRGFLQNELSASAPRVRQMESEEDEAANERQHRALVKAFREGSDKVAQEIREKPTPFPWKNGYILETWKGRDRTRRVILPED